MQLFLVRHAIAEERDGERWPEDALRPLTQRGRSRFERAAAGLCRLGVDVDLLLSSPFARAWETAGILTEVAGWPEARAFERAAPGHRPEHVLAEFGRLAAGGVASIAMVGHQPDLQQLASFLVTGIPGSLGMRWRKGGVAWLRCEGPPRPGTAEIEAFMTPKLLRRVADGARLPTMDR